MIQFLYIHISMWYTFMFLFTEYDCSPVDDCGEIENHISTEQSCAGVLSRVVWCEACTAHAIKLRISPQGSMYLNIWLFKSLVRNIWFRTWCTRSIGAFAYGFFIEVGTGLISKSFRSGMKSCLNSEPLSKTTHFGRGYLNGHVLLKSWLILAEVLSIYSWFCTLIWSKS